MFQKTHLNQISTAYTTVYSLCYIVSPILGLKIIGVNPIITTPLLMLIGASLLFSLHCKNQGLIYALCALEAVGCVAHFLRIIPWTPQFTNNGYLIMSLLDLLQAVFLYILIEK